MKKLLILVLIIVISGLSVSYAQNNQNNNDDTYEYENDDGIDYIYDSVEMKQVQRFGSGLPAIDITRSRMSSEEEFIFKTYIMEKLLKSNRILY